MQKKWVTKQLNKDEMYEIARSTGLPLSVSAILQKRGMGTLIGEFLEPDGMLYHCSLLKDLDKACQIICDLIADCVKNKEPFRVAIINDYDVDGVTSGVILYEAFSFICSKFGCNFNGYILPPNRDIDGYGISKRLIDEAKKKDCQLVITCDNGVSACEQIDYAKSLGFTVIVTDHHEVPFQKADDGTKTQILPMADAVVDPKRLDCDYPFKEICGAMVAYKLFLGLIPYTNTSYEQLGQICRRLEELVGIATVCDVMPLVCENRTVVMRSLKNINEKPSYIGLRALLHEQNITNITSYTYGFIIGPCLNAIGRMTGDSYPAVSLLLEKDHMKALSIARKLIRTNEERKNLCQSELDKGMEIAMNTDNRMLFLYLPNSSAHIMGIVAGKIKENTNLPCVCLTDDKDGLLKGSGRSIDGYNMFEELSKHKELYESFGGHAGAVGITIKKSNFEAIRKLVNHDIMDYPDDLFYPTTEVDLLIPFGNISMEYIEGINRLEPFGNANPAPLLGCYNVCVNKLSRFGKESQYIRLNLSYNEHAYSAVFFGDSKKLDDYIADSFGEDVLSGLYSGEKSVFMDLLYTASINTYDNSIQFIIKDYRKTGE